MPEINSELVTAIASLAARVASEHAALLETTAAETAAKAALLDAVIGALKPALAALSSRVRASEYTSGLATDRQREGKTYYTWRGVRAYGDGPELDCPRDTAGSYEGCALFLCTDGTWMEVTYSGTWSRWQGSHSEWTGDATPLSTAQVAAKYEVDTLIERLTTTLSKHDGSRVQRTAASATRVERLRAVVSLLAGIRR